MRPIRPGWMTWRTRDLSSASRQLGREMSESTGPFYLKFVVIASKLLQLGNPKMPDAATRVPGGASAAPDLPAALRARGMRVTPQRLAVHAALHALGRHSTAEEVLD